jgi:5-methylcytosine-specific restriction endonuclease McrA
MALGGTAKQKWEMESRLESRQHRKAEALKQWAAVCKQVDKRDAGHCRVCRRRCSPAALAMMERAERHHIVYRSAGGEDFSHNVVTLCAFCHAAQHAAQIDVRGNADYGIEVWQRDPLDNEWFMSKRETSCGVVERD